MPTIQDVARRAGVGAATVSRVLSGKGYVKSETRERIRQAIEELHYTPNEMARNLYYQKSGIVAVIVPELAHPFVAQLVSAMEVALCAAGYQTMVCNTFYERNYEQRYLDMLKRRMVDGLIFAAHTSLDVSQYQNLDLPIVGFDRILGPDIPCVSADHEAGGRMAAEALLACGCRNVLQFVGAYYNGARQGVWPTDWVITPAVSGTSSFSRSWRPTGPSAAACWNPICFCPPTAPAGWWSRRSRPTRMWTAFLEPISMPWPASTTRWSTGGGSPGTCGSSPTTAPMPPSS